MRKHQKEILQSTLDDEKKELNHLKAIYKKTLQDISGNIKIYNDKIEILLADIDEADEYQKSVLQSQIYHRDFQRNLQKQLNAFLNDLNNEQYKSINDYIEHSYEGGYVATMYDIAQQGVPIIAPIDQKKVIKAMSIDSKISKTLYEKLGEDVNVLKKRIANNISRGIAAAESYEVIARNIANDSNVGFNKAMRIARTEGHRVHQQAAFDAQHVAKDKGADVVKQWNSVLDGRVRTTHRKLDGQLREVDEPFEMDGKKAMHPSGFGRPEEDINCRCVMLQRARWALDDDELETLKERAAFHGLDKAEDFEDFKKKYLKAAAEEVVTMPKGFIPAKTIEEAQKVAQDAGVKYAIYNDLPLETANLLNEALLTIPKDARPVFVGSSKTLEAYRGGKLPRTSKNYYGVSVYQDGIRLGMNKYDFDTYGNMIGISSHYKTADKITKAKEVAQEAYVKAHGNKWFFNIDGRATAFHEMGHAYADKYGLPEGFERVAERWAKESGCDMLKKASEAWAEAWGAYHIGNPDLPDYISEFIEKAATKANKSVLKGSIMFDEDGIINKKIEQFRKDFEAGKISTKISFQKQSKHRQGRKEFEDYKERMFAKIGKYPSYVREDLTNKDLEELVVSKLRGNVQINGNDEYREFVKCDEVIGSYYDKAKGEYVPTRTAQVKYALGGKNIHVIPVKDL